MKKHISIGLLFFLLIPVSLYPLSKTDRAIHHAAQITGLTIGALLGYVGVPKLAKTGGVSPQNKKILESRAFQTVFSILAVGAGIDLGTELSSRYFQQKYKVSARIVNIALRYNYDLSTDQKLILQAAEQKNNSIIKKYLTDLLQQHFGEHGIEKFQSFIREYRTIMKSHKNPSTMYQSFVEKIGNESATLLTAVLVTGILPLAVLYFNIDDWIYEWSVIISPYREFYSRMQLAYDLMKAVGVYKK